MVIRVELMRITHIVFTLRLALLFMISEWENCELRHITLQAAKIRKNDLQQQQQNSTHIGTFTP